MEKITRRVTIVLLGCLVYFGSILSSCMPGVASTFAVTPAAVAATSAPAKLAWQQKWNSLVDAAKKEGRVVISAHSGTERQALTQGFKAKYGIDVDFIVGRSAEILPKISAERKAGLYLRDVNITGVSSNLTYKEAGFLEEPLDSFLILPEVLDPKAWRGGRGINFIGKNRYALSFLSRPTLTVAINAELVKPGEIKSYRDLLNPRWKGKMVMQDPTVSGAGNIFMTLLTWELMSKDYFYELAKQAPIITRDKRIQVEWVSRGKYPIMIAPDSDMVWEFVRAGAPIKVIWPVEGTGLSAGHGCLSLMNKAAHPAAARVFINWLLTQEGQTIFAKAGGTQSARIDLVHDWVDPESLAQPGGKYVIADTEESGVLRVKTIGLAKEIFGHLTK